METPRGLFYTVTYVEVLPFLVRDAINVLRQHYDDVDRASSTQQPDLVQRVDRPSHFAILAAWSGQQAYEDHLASEYVQRLNTGLAPLVAAPNDTRQHHGLDVGEPALSAASGGITVVTHVDVVPPEKDNAVEVLQRLAVESRQHRGNHHFDVWQQTNRPNHFTVVEGWSDRTAVDEHAAAPETRAFRASLSTMTGALYDERWYTALQ